MQRKWRRAWLHGKPHYMRYKQVRKVETRSIKSKVYNLTAKTIKKLVPAAAAAGIFLSSLTGVQANPTGGSIAAGTGSITGQGTSNVTINQASDKLSINWNSFSIASGEKVQFIQPGASSIALNRVLGNNASSIYGQLSANGKVFLINPNGVLFAQGAQVNVGGLVASTLQLSDKDFLSGKYTFSGDSQQGVLNQGNITAANGGYVALLGANATNESVILAKEGTAAMGAGSKVSLDFTGDGLLTLSVDESKVKAQVKNSGLIKADGGLVVMNAKAADSLTGSVVNNSGTIEAKSVTSKNGAIILTGDNVTNAGTLDASGKNAGETGGTVKVLGDTVKVASGASIDVSGDKGGGTALIGGAYQGGSSEYAATKTTVEQGTSINADALTTSNGGQVVVWANDTTTFAGNISAKGGTVSGDGGSVETSGHKTLTVADTANVNTTAANGKTGNWLLDPADFVVDNTGTKGMTAAALSAALQSSGVTITTNDSDTIPAKAVKTSDSTDIGTNVDVSGNGDITISSAVKWDAAGNLLTLSAYRNININANVTASGANAGLALTYGTGTTGSYSLGSGAKITLAGENAKFSLNGNNYTVINNHSTGGALIALQNINNNLSGKYFLGENIDASATKDWDGGAGFTTIGSDASQFKGTFDGGGHTISGLTINRSNSYIVGLFGYTKGASLSNIGLVNASVSGLSEVGGLVGMNSGTITNSYVTGSVTGTGDYVGGLVGWNIDSSTITNSYANVSVRGAIDVGGLVGYNSSGTIANSYATGSVIGTGNNVGGLVGHGSESTITNSYATGSVTGIENRVGGLVGYNSGTITNSYWDADSTGQTKGVGNATDNEIAGQYTALYSSKGGTGTAFNQASYGGFDFANTWYMLEGSTRPFLRSEYSTAITNAHQLQLMAMDLTANYTLANNIDMGELTKASGMWRATSTADSSGNYGFTPIGNGTTQFKGAFDGGGHTVSGLTIHSNASDVGLFASTDNSKISNIGLVGGSVTGTKDNSDVGGLVGRNGGSITNFYNTGSVEGTGNNSAVGGLVGQNAGSITNSYNGGSVEGTDMIGGLVGLNAGSITYSYNAGSVTGTQSWNKVGGLVGWNPGGSIDGSYNTGKVTGIEDNNSSIGGLVGAGNFNITGSYWDVNSTGQDKGVGKTENDATRYIGLTSAKMKMAGSFSGWADCKDTNGNNVWYFYDGLTAPLLRSFLTPLTITVSGASPTSEYNGTAYSPLGTVSSYPVLSGSLSYGNVVNGSYTVNTGNAGTYTLGGLYSNQQGYAITYAGATGLTITPKALSATQKATVTKTYNKDNTATFDNTNLTLIGVVGSDSVVVSGTGTYDSVNAGDRTVTVTGVTLNNANYKLDASSVTGSGSEAGNLIGHIDQKALSATQAATVSKTYDKNDSAVFDAANITLDTSGVIGGDSVSISGGTGTYDSVNAGNRTVTVTGVTLNNTNYKLDASSVTGSEAGKLTGTIDKASLTITATANTKTYDGTTTATAAPTYTGLVAGDKLEGLVEAYTDQNAGSGKTLKVMNGYTLTDGNNGGNYTITTVDAAGIIDKRQLTATATVQNKVYDGNTNATVGSVNFGNFADGEMLTAGYTGGTFSDRNVGDNKTVNISGLTMTVGANTLADNYLLPTNVASNASITPAALTIMATTNTKTYDGTNTANDTPTYNSNDVKTGDTLTVSETYDNKNVGTNKTLTVSYVMDDGNGGKNYNVITQTATGTINQKDLTIKAVTNTKTYDGTNSANATPTYNNNEVQTGDTLTVSETYDNKNAGTDKNLTVSYVMDDGNGGKNYNVITQTATGTINQKDLTIKAVTNTKTYDGTNSANATPTYNNNEVQTGDTLTVSETYDNKNAGNNKTLTVSYALEDGNGGKNYNVITQMATGTINQKDLTVTANNDAKIYDKTAYADGKGVTYTGLATGETGSDLSGSLTYGGNSQGATEVGTYTITPGGLTSTNYIITFKDGTLIIKPAAITDPAYIAAVQNTQQKAGDNTAGNGETPAHAPAANATPQQLPAGQVSPIQYSSDNTGTPHIITTAGQTVTIAKDSPVQLATNPVQREIAVYQTANGSTALATAYHVDGSEGSLALRESAASFAPVSSRVPASVLAQAETSSFQLTDSNGNAANFTIAYTGGGLYVQAANAVAADMLSQNRQLITATSLVAAQDKLSIDINDLQTVHLEK